MVCFVGIDYVFRVNRLYVLRGGSIDAPIGNYRLTKKGRNVTLQATDRATVFRYYIAGLLHIYYAPR